MKIIIIACALILGGGGGWWWVGLAQFLMDCCKDVILWQVILKHYVNHGK